MSYYNLINDVPEPIVRDILLKHQQIVTKNMDSLERFYQDADGESPFGEKFFQIWEHEKDRYAYNETPTGYTAIWAYNLGKQKMEFHTIDGGSMYNAIAFFRRITLRNQKVTYDFTDIKVFLGQGQNYKNASIGAELNPVTFALAVERINKAKRNAIVIEMAKNYL